MKNVGSADLTEILEFLSLTVKGLDLKKNVKMKLILVTTGIKKKNMLSKRHEFNKP